VDFGVCGFNGTTEFVEVTFEQDADFRDATFGLTPSGRYSYERLPPSRRISYSPPPPPDPPARDGSTPPAPTKPPLNWVQGTPPTRYVVDFTGATFAKKALFDQARFSVHEANFDKATFSEQGVDFSHSEFTGRVEFGARFLGPVRFWKTKFREDSELSPGPVFTSAEFSLPTEVFFYQTYLGQALFHNCDVSEFHFSSVRWRKRGNTDRNMVFEEIARSIGELDPPAEEVEEFAFPSPPLERRRGPPGWEVHRARQRNERNYRLVTELYQQLKRNFDERGDYLTAGDFHYGEMEMKRLFSRHRNSILRWLHRHFGLAAWYRRASDYGQNYVRPVLWLAAIFVSFTLLYPLVGLNHCLDEQGRAAGCLSEAGKIRTPATLTYFNPLGRDDLWPSDGPRAWLHLIGHSAIATLQIATLDKQPEYQPNYPWGRLFIALQVVLTATLCALFVLALNRKFKR
jgi:hypothetical protein